jgi:fused signal recognition particle receptor
MHPRQVGAQFVWTSSDARNRGDTMRAFSAIQAKMFSLWKKKPAPTPPDAESPVSETAIAADPVEQPGAATKDAPRSPDADPASEPGSVGIAPEITITDAAALDRHPAGDPPGWRDRLRNNSFARGLSSLFVRHPKLDDDLLDQIETCLLTADVGVSASTELTEGLRGRMHRREFAHAGELVGALRADLLQLVQPLAQPLNVDAGPRPFVLLVVGVNGVGKTTTIGKLAKRLSEERKQVLLAAGDTFRAAAVEQL